MLFNSLHFAIFFPLVTGGYFLLPYRFRNAWLLLCSCYFYMAFVPYYILILLFTILIDYAAGILIARASGPARKSLLTLSIVANVGVLAVFKYFGFMNQNLHGLAEVIGWNYSPYTLSILLPIGLSFHTFQSMSYTIEVYRGNQEPERNPLIFALYVMFYPQLVAGPIERPQNLLHQFHEKHDLNYRVAVQGLQLMAWGLFKKVVVADRLAAFVNRVYDAPTHYTGLPLIVASWAFAFQIFCDFSGYSDIAVGAAQVMGFRLMTNFRQPYLAQSVSEFWKRWHISLSTWFRDYLYIPLGGSRVAKSRQFFNIMVVFLVSGLWHGASWTFVVWGGLNGLFIVCEAVSQPVLAKIPRILRLFITFNLICLTWVFFRARTVSDAMYIIRHLIPVSIGREIAQAVSVVGSMELAVVALLIAFTYGMHRLQERYCIRELIQGQSTAVRWATYCGGLTALVLLAQFGSGQRFIYFQF